MGLVVLLLGSVSLQALTLQDERSDLAASQLKNPPSAKSLTTTLPEPFWIEQTQHLFEKDHPSMFHIGKYRAIRYGIGEYSIDSQASGHQARFNENPISYEAEAKNAFESKDTSPNNDHQLLPDLFALTKASKEEPSQVVVSGQPDWTEIIENQKLYITNLNLKIRI